MKNKKYQKLGALWRAPAIQATKILVVTLAVIGMVTYVGLYNPRANLASAKPSPVPTARDAPVELSLPGYTNGQKIRTVDLSLLISSGMHNDAAYATPTHIKKPPLEVQMAVMNHWKW